MGGLPAVAQHGDSHGNEGADGRGGVPGCAIKSAVHLLWSFQLFYVVQIKIAAAYPRVSAYVSVGDTVSCSVAEHSQKPRTVLNWPQLLSFSAPLDLSSMLTR